MNLFFDYIIDNKKGGAKNIWIHHSVILPNYDATRYTKPGEQSFYLVNKMEFTRIIYKLVLVHGETIRFYNYLHQFQMH